MSEPILDRAARAVIKAIIENNLDDHDMFEMYRARESDAAMEIAMEPARIIASAVLAELKEAP